MALYVPQIHIKEWLNCTKSQGFYYLSKFDGNRYLDLKKKWAVTKNNLYEIRGFKKSNNAYLTRDEKWQLKLKSK